MSFQVFISYSSTIADTAVDVCKGLEAKGIRCWIAPRNIPPGSTYGNSIITAIKDSFAFVLIFSKKTNESQYVLQEVERAVHYDKKIILFRVEDVLPSGDLELFLSATQWIDAKILPLEPHIETLAQAIQALLRGMESEKKDFPVNQKRRSYRTVYIGVVILFLLTFIGAFWFIDWRYKHSSDNGFSAKPDPYQNLSQEYVERIIKGEKEFHLGRYDAALEQFSLAQKLYPQETIAYIRIAWVYLNVGEFERVVASASEAIKIDPDCAEAYGYRALGGLFFRSLSDIKVDAEMGFRLNDQCAIVLLARGMVHKRTGNPEEAAKSFKQAQDLDPKNPLIWAMQEFSSVQTTYSNINKAKALSYNSPLVYYISSYFQEDDPNAKRSDSLEVLRLLKDSSLGGGLRADAYLNNSDFDSALKEAKNVIQENPKSPFGYVLQAKILISKKKVMNSDSDCDKERKPQEFKLPYDMALEDIETANRMEPAYIWAYTVKSEIHEKMGKLDLARDDLSQAIKIEPKNASLFLQRALVFLKTDKSIDCNIDLAMDDIETATNLDKDFVLFQVYACIATGRSEMARTICMNNLSEYPGLKLFMSLIEFQEHNWVEAKNFLDQLPQDIKIESHFRGMIYYMKVCIGCEIKDWETVIKYADLLKKEYGGDALLQCFLGRAFMGQGKFMQAKKTFDIFAEETDDIDDLLGSGDPEDWEGMFVREWLKILTDKVFFHTAKAYLQLNEIEKAKDIIDKEIEIEKSDGKGTVSAETSYVASQIDFLDDPENADGMKYLLYACATDTKNETYKKELFQRSQQISFYNLQKVLTETTVTEGTFSLTFFPWLDENKDDKRFSWLQAIIRAGRYQYDEAIKYATQWIEQKPANVYVAYYIRGLCYEQMKDYKKAITDYDACLSIKPEGVDEAKECREECLKKIVESAQIKASDTTTRPTTRSTSQKTQGH